MTRKKETPLPPPRSASSDDREEDEFPREGRGRAASRREAKSFDAFALRLMALPPQKVGRLPVSQILRRCLHTVQNTKSKAAKRRHQRELAGMLRTRPSEAEAILAFLEGRAFTAIDGNEDNRDLEALRAQLCETENFTETLNIACERMPHIDLLLVRDLCSSLHGMAAKELVDSKAYRALFKELRRATEAALDED